MAASVLLVDDSRNIREFCGRILARDGYRVRLAANGDEALARLREETPDVVVLDVRLPRTSGLDLLGRIAATAPVILFSSHPEAFADDRARRARACVHKDESLAGLKAALERVLGEPRAPAPVS